MGALKGDTEIDNSLTNIRWLRILGVALGVVVTSFFFVTVITAVYAFILAFQARGTPDQTAIGHFAATISRWLIPLLEILLTFFASAMMVRKTKNTNVIHGLFVGILVGLLSIIVTLIFAHHLGFYNSIFFLITAGLGWLGGFIEQKRKIKFEANTTRL